ncbi:MAG: hypothetical protein ACI8QQ_000822 [Psychroserpens sp.]|jgi:hypothetical protein
MLVNRMIGDFEHLNVKKCKYTSKNCTIFRLINSKFMSKELKNQPIEITEKGSLGLLALGDVGLRAWRKVKKEAQQKRKDEEKK